LEGRLTPYTSSNARFTTGNTLTPAFIVKGVERAAAMHKLDLRLANVLIIGATGDIGRGCVGYFQNRVKRLLLCARNKSRLKTLSDQIEDAGANSEYSTDLSELLPRADLIICVASATELPVSSVKPHVIVCDAGYPKNLLQKAEEQVGMLFHGGMGMVECGYRFQPDYTDSFYQYPAPGIIHGCILEAMVLAFENRFEDYSSGRGNITVEKVEEIYQLALKHGVVLAPFFNGNGLCPAIPIV
jgi:predicted amino acid dehydrogenase